jgi:hypothetical protein
MNIRRTCVAMVSFFLLGAATHATARFTEENRREQERWKTDYEKVEENRLFIHDVTSSPIMENNVRTLKASALMAISDLSIVTLAFPKIDDKWLAVTHEQDDFCILLLGDNFKPDSPKYIKKAKADLVHERYSVNQWGSLTLIKTKERITSITCENKQHKLKLTRTASTVYNTEQGSVTLVNPSYRDSEASSWSYYISATTHYFHRASNLAALCKLYGFGAPLEHLISTSQYGYQRGILNEAMVLQNTVYTGEYISSLTCKTTDHLISF